MRYILVVVLVLTMLMAVASSAAAEEPAKYNFASVQGAKEIGIIPGGEGAGNMYFYNIEGNRITHVTLEVSQSPAGWQVEIQPPLGEAQFEINGEVVTVTENLYIEPSEASSEEIVNVPEGMVCIPVATRGYALAKEARILVRVPAAEEIGATGDVMISATASWLGQSGAAAFNQSRDFTFSVEVVSEVTEVNEVVLGKNNTNIWLPVIIAVAGIALGSILTLLYIKRKRG